MAFYDVEYVLFYLCSAIIRVYLCKRFFLHAKNAVHIEYVDDYEWKNL
mgnify:CR=1 FL=1